ncbi:hypothetical protein L1987_77494 [Smallanthus sonchifolius]|uniref:Uncharacterized protein n=1 Tax=Smallanthus sonchifolius TaxID=185202 RepID=A0ACB8ZAB0_9ASTR|nr:hypothetical protein L1987_77494 [Smallanthus sonchifolius]
MNTSKMMALLAVKHMRDIRVLDWRHLQNWNSNIPPRFNNNTVPVMESRFSGIKKMIKATLDSYFNERLALRVRYHLMELEFTTPSIASMDRNGLLRIKKYGSSNALLQLTLKDGIPFFKFVVAGSSDLLAAAVKKLPSGKDDTSLVYAFYSVRESSKEKGYCFEYNIVGQMKICSSHHAEFNGPEKGLFVVRESVLYSMLEGELAAIVGKNSSGESWGGMESRSRTTTVVLPDCVHTWRISGSRSTVLVLVSVADGLYSLEYDPSMSLLQAFSICVAVVSSHNLTHIFQVNDVLAESKKTCLTNRQLESQKLGFKY